MAKRLQWIALFCLLFAQAASGATVSRAGFQKKVDGKQVDLYTLKNPGGVEILITNYGGRIVSILQPDTTGKVADVVLGYATLEEYQRDPMYLGGIVGRYANRIAQGKFSLEGQNGKKTYELAKNAGVHTLHGGAIGFDKHVWDATQSGNTLTLTYVSPDGEEGYPGTLKVKAVYSLDKKDRLTLDLEATTDQTTVVSLTNHSYFNFAGEGSGDVLSQRLEFAADHYLPLTDTGVPTGKVAPVKGTPFDFRKPVAIGSRIEQADPQLKIGRGYDHCIVLKKGEKTALKVSDPASGRTMEISTDQPGIQFYTGNFMDGKVTGKSGLSYGYRGGFTLQPEHFPDSPNQPGFPSSELKAGDTYRFKASYRFYAKR